MSLPSHEFGRPPPPLDQYVIVDPDRLGGEPCFRGTRVPVRSLFQHLAAGDSVAVFLDDFEGVTQEQVRAVIRFAERGFFDGLRAA